MSQLKGIVDQLLTNVSSALLPEGFIAEGLLPQISSKQSTGLLAKYGNSHLRIESSLKGGRAAYKRVETITRSTTGFSIEGHGLEGMVTKEDYANISDPYKAEEDETMGITTMLAIEKEKALADTLSDTAILTQNVTLSGTSQFSSYLDSDPIAVMSTARTTCRSGCGSVPNTMIMDWAVMNVLRYHPALLDFLGYKQSRPGGLKPEELAAAFDVEQVIIAKSIYNSAKEGQADVIAPVWGKHIILAVLPKKAMPYQCSLGYMVGYEGEKPRKVYKQDNFNPPGSTSILVEDSYDLLLSNAGAAYLIKAAIA